MGPGFEPVLQHGYERVGEVEKLGIEGDSEDVDGGSGVETVFDRVAVFIGCAPEGYAFVEMGVKGCDAGNSVFFGVHGMLCFVSVM